MRNLIGQRFGHLIVLEFHGHKRRSGYWKVQCDCGRQSVARGPDLFNRQRFCSQSCPLLSREHSKKTSTHGLSKHPLFARWVSMRHRGDITHDRWQDPANFLQDVAPSFREDCLLRPLDRSMPIGPSNFVWAPKGSPKQHAPKPLFKKNLSGMVFGNLTVDSFNPISRLWNVTCKCGTKLALASSSPSKRKFCSRSCSLYRQFQKDSQPYPVRTQILRRVWSHILERCYNPQSMTFKHYGAKGIHVSDEWRNNFHAFARDMAPTHFNGATIDRINNLLGYSKENCRWLSAKENQRNRSNNAIIQTPLGPMSIAEACERFYVKRKLVDRRRHAGWPDDRLLIRPGQ